MRIIEPSFQIVSNINGMQALQDIEYIARTCYKSEEYITDISAVKMVECLIHRGHEAMLEHYSFSVKFIVDRGVSHEIIRHRVASYAQESTRYCNYAKDRFGNEITVIKPCYLAEDTENYRIWKEACEASERAYFNMLDNDATPQEARAVLPMSLKTEVCMTANLREWRHFFKLRAVGITGAPHPQMCEVTVPLLAEVKDLIPVVFDDIICD